MGEALQAALNKLDLVQVGHKAGLVFDKLPRCGHGSCRDPFRSDDTHPSFQVVADDRGRAVGFKDYTGDATGNIWQFAQRCWPGLSSGDLAAKLIDMAGTGNLDTKHGSAIKSTREQRVADERKLRREQRERVEQRLSAQNDMPQAAAPPQPADASTYDRYREGVAFASERWALVEALCARRGWPEGWADELISSEALGYPLLPWLDVGKDLRDRGWAFRVQGVRSPMAERHLEPLVWMGYHQQFYRSANKSWVFCPNMGGGPRKSDYQKSSQGYYAAQGVKSGEKLVDPVPFVVGDVHHPRLVVVVEGQWDAVTLFGALGGFDDGDPIPVLVFGLRGVSSIEQIFRYWGRWLRWQAAEGGLANIWLLADADEPGKRLVFGRGRVGEVPELSFADRLKAIIGCRVVASYTNKVKDFNDYYKATSPSVSDMWGLLGGLRLI